jgi:hypothetical protein
MSFGLLKAHTKASDSGACDELCSTGIEKHGLGNWTSIAKHVGKPKQACEDHYWGLYIAVHGQCLPEYTLTAGTIGQQARHTSCFLAQPDDGAIRTIAGHKKGEKVLAFRFKGVREYL